MSDRDVTSFIYYRDSGLCRYCGLRLRRSEATVDHYLPSSRGGDDGADNLRLCCEPCNNLKADMPPEAWEGVVAQLKLREKVAKQQGRFQPRRIAKIELLQRCAPRWRQKFLKGAT